MVRKQTIYGIVNVPKTKTFRGKRYKFVNIQRTPESAKKTAKLFKGTSKIVKVRSGKYQGKKMGAVFLR